MDVLHEVITVIKGVTRENVSYRTQSILKIVSRYLPDI